tara:strand:+ start:123 stop:584 length:462 start_codon:yes stop_codon:yes gene_type:complete
MKLTKSRLKRIIKEEINKVLEADEMVYAGGTQEPTYDDLANSSDTVKDYLAVMRAYAPGAHNENFTLRGVDGEKHMIEVLKLMWDFMRVNPGNTDAGLARAKELGYNESDAIKAVANTNGINSTSPTGDMMMNAVEAMGPAAVDARSLPGGSA